jgi:hypothetical protein
MSATAIQTIDTGKQQNNASGYFSQVNVERKPSARRTVVANSAYQPSGSRVDIQPPVNPATINRAIMTTAERNRKIFEVNQRLRESQANKVANTDEAPSPSNYRPAANTNSAPSSSNKSTNIVKTKLLLTSALNGSRVFASLVFMLAMLSIYIFGFGLIGLGVEVAVTYTLSWLPNFLSSFVRDFVGTPGITIFGFSYILLVFIGLVSILPFAILYYFTNKKAFAGYAGLTLLIVCALYFTPFLNFLPWWALWVGMVYIQITADQIKAKMGQR